MRRIITFFLVTIASCSLKAQTTDQMLNTAVVTPPNAAAFTQYAKVPVGEFTGIPDIKVPLHNIKVDNLTIPIYLSYYARGVQPNVHSGWVGTGWNLIANGAITRKVNGLADEYCSDYVTYPPPAGNSKYGWYFGANHTQSYSVTNVMGNLVTADPFGNGTWTKIIAIDSAPDEFDFNFNGLSGSFFLGSDGKWKVHSANGDNIQIQETLGSVTINPLQNPTSAFNSQTINPTFIQFVLTTGDGTHYIFGGNPSSGGSNATIDFNRRGPSSESYNNNLTAVAWHLTEIDLPTGKKITYQYFRNGSQFTYAPHSSCTYTNNFYANSSTTVNGNTIEETDFNINIMDPVYLQSITFPEGSIIFHSTLSGESDLLESGNTSSIRDAFNNTLPAVIFPGIVNSYNVWHSYTDVLNSYNFNSQGNITSLWYKLTDIELDDYKGNKLRDFQLTYNQDANTRLFLQSVQETAPGISIPPYTFTYNSLPLPAYCTIHTDHWGFYNGPKTFPTWAFDNLHFVTTTFQNQYYQFREPDLTYVQAGILTKINYPTGGYSQFFYETNQYLKWMAMPLSINQAATTMYGGGLRIQKIITTDNANLSPITYEYNYVNDLTNNISSGVLGMPRPNYTQHDQVSWASYDSNGNPLASAAGSSFGLWDSNIIYPSQNDDGNIVTYSNVIERQSSNGIYNGMTVTVFSNHDNGYANTPPDHIAFSLNSAVEELENSDRSFERGKILTESIFDQNNYPIKTIQNTYNNDANRFNQYVGAIKCNMKMFSAAQIVQFGGAQPNNPYWVYSSNNSAIRYYTFYPFLQQTVETNYPSDHSANTFTKTSNYFYDQVNGTRNLVKSTETDSKGQILTNNIKYPLDYNITGIPTTNDPFTVGIENLQSSSLYAVSMPIENTTQLSNSDGSNLRTIGSALNSYDAHFPFPNLTYKASIINPTNTFTSSSISSASGSLVKDGTYEPHIMIDNFDAVGNLLQEHTATGANQSYQWGYNNNYLVAVVKNALNTQQVTPSTSTSTGSTYIRLINGSTSTYSTNFNVSANGTTNMILGFTGSPGTNADAQVTVTLSGPNNYSATIPLCLATGTASCGSYVSTWSASNLAQGTYTLTAKFYQTQNLTSDVQLTGSFPITTTTYTTTGAKEFYYNNFEEDPAGVTGSAHTGRKYGTASTIGWDKPNARAYVISYWYLLSGVWKYSGELSYTGSSSAPYSLITSTGYDDIRIYPSDAKMTSYTYDPLVGITSAIDAKGETTYYEYDSFQRLINIKDKDANIIKNIAYNYANQQASSVPSPSNPIVVQNITGTAVSLLYLLPTTAQSTSCYLQYTDLTTLTVYQSSINCGTTGSTTIIVPAQGHTYKFVIVQNLTAGGQVVSIPTNVSVP